MRRRLACDRGSGVRLLGFPSRAVSGSQRNVVLDSLLHLVDLSDQLVQIVHPLHKVDVRGVEDEQRGGCVVKEEIVVSAIQFRDVALRDSNLVVPASPAYSFQQHLVRGLQIDNQIGPRDILLQKRIELLINHQLGIVQVQVGENLVLGKDVI